MDQYKNSVSDIAHIKSKKDTFWIYAEVSHSYARGHPRNKYKRCQYDLEFGRDMFRRRRRYVDARTGEVRETIEIEIGSKQT